MSRELAGGIMAAFKSKKQVRAEVWGRMLELGVARPFNKIPPFPGQEAAASLLRTLDVYKDAARIFVPPDAAQYHVRLNALKDGKVVIMATPALAEGFYELDPTAVDEKVWRLAVRSKEVFKYGRRLKTSLEDIGKVDLMVTGAVAVSRGDGCRIGKGTGFFDLEYAILKEIGSVGETTPIIAVVHDSQVFDELPHDKNDVAVNFIVTPSQIIKIEKPRKRPVGIDWKRIDNSRILKIRPLMELETKIKISKAISYILRHKPSPKMRKDGFMSLKALLKDLRKRVPYANEELIVEVVENDPKGRYELRDGMIRARYGHSIDVQIKLPAADVATLYHGTTEDAAAEILREGLKPVGRRKVHLSASVEDAIEVGKRRTDRPVVLRIDAKAALAEGVRIEKATDRVYVADFIPPEFISLLDGDR
ncbi:MAG: 5-formyltetrahydrofolate cyclo-ligase [Candidatus Alkanophagales archaeon MCA70_species_2]|nr:5-formyltetrahydrofolate cyclo-ligase [Candidatus Alkanophaga liquidiphilum]